MRYILLLLSILLVQTASAQKKAETVHIRTAIYCDHCKECESCSERLEEAVYRVKGVRRFELDEKSATIKVIFHPQKTNAVEIRKAIAAVGFDADDVKAFPEAYEQLDDCCKQSR